VAIKPILQFRNQDSTLDLNSTQARIVDRAIFDGGTLTPSGVSLQVTIAPFIASGYDGMVAVSDTTETRSIPAPAAAGPARVSYLILHLEYRSLTTPIVNLQVVPETTWLTSVSRNYFVTFARFSIPFGATSLTDPGVVIDYSAGDWADKLGKTGWRMPVATVAALPLTQNRDGDVRIAFDTRLAYAWNASTSTWSPIGGAINIAEVAARGAESKHQWHRVTSGSGFLNEIPQAPSGTTVAGSAVRGSGVVQFPFIPISVVANTAIIPGCHYLFNGHFVKTHARELTFPAAPGVGERFDLLFLEVWREAIVLPSSETYDDQGGAPQTFATLRTALEQMTEQGGTLASSFDLSEMEVYDSSTFVVTRYQYRIAQNVNVSVLTDTATVAAGILNVDGNAFSVGSNTDQKLWQAAAATTSHDDVSWAIPLMVVRRTSDELAGPPFIDTFRGDQRYVFDVAPRAELGIGLIEVEETLVAKASADAAVAQLERPAGFITGTNDPIVINDGSLDIPASLIQVMGRYLRWASPSNVALPAPPATGGRTDLLVLEVFQTAFTPPSPAADAGPEVQFRARIGPKSTKWVAKFRFFSLPLNVLETTAEDAMSAALVYTPVAGEPALWSRTATPLTGEDPTSSVWAMPVCLVHRRNTGAYTLTVAGQNGADRSLFPGLPNQPATHPYAGEVLDVRARSVVDPEELQRILDESFDQLIAGDLRTNMREHPLASSVAGTQLLQVDQIAPAALAGTQLIPNVPNGRQTVWSESDEAELFTWSFLNMDVDHADPTGVFAWTAATNTLSISLPQGYMLSLDPQNAARPYGPQAYVAYSIDGNVAGDRRPIPMNHAYFSGAAPVGWFIQGDSVSPTPMRQTEVTLTLNAEALLTYTEATAIMLVGVWAVKRNHEAGRSSGLNSYANNRGLFAVPDTVHRIEYSLTGVAPFKRAWVGVPLNVVDVPVVGDALVIDRATLFASGSISSQIASAAGALFMYAVANVTLSTTSSADKIRYIQFTDAGGTFPAFERCRIEFNAGTVPVGTTARVTLVSIGDLVDHWFEVDPGSKQVRGPYTITQNLFSTTASAQHLTFEAPSPLCPWSDCGVSVLGGLSVGGSVTAAASSGGSFPGFTEVSFYAAGTANAAWEIWFNAADRDSLRNISVGQTLHLQQGYDISGAPGTYMNIGSYSPMFSLRYTYTAGAVGNHNSMMVVPCRAPLPTGAVARVYYSYTPYQGITTDLETKINGTVEGISDQIVFTNGPNKSWLDYRLLATTIRHSSQSSAPPGVYGYTSSSGVDIGLLYSKGRIIDRYYLQANDGPNYGGYFAAEDLAKPFRQADRPPLAISQRLPFPTKAANGASVGSRYSPESYLSHTALLDESAVRPVLVTSGYARSEASPWLLEYSSITSDEAMWRSQNALTTLYFPLPVHLGETVVGVTLETESAGPSGVLSCFFISRNRETGAVTASGETFYATVQGPAGTRLLHEVSIIPTVLSSAAKTEVLLAIQCSTSNLRVGGITIGVIPNTAFVTGSSTLRRYPYDDVRSSGVGKTLRKGMRIEVPSTWVSEFASYESVLIQDGRQDYSTVSPPRGRALVSTLLGNTTYGTGGLIGYVPGGDPVGAVFQLGGFSAALPYAGRETAPRFNAKVRSVVTGATAPDVSAGTALAYIVHTEANSMYMGVSTGYSNITNSTATLRVGQAVDAFYPVGRPVFRRT
jgi:hypothetical protein